jgi:hypothetical protein
VDDASTAVGDAIQWPSDTTSERDEAMHRSVRSTAARGCILRAIALLIPLSMVMLLVGRSAYSSRRSSWFDHTSESADVVVHAERRRTHRWMLRSW